MPRARTGMEKKAETRVRSNLLNAAGGVATHCEGEGAGSGPGSGGLRAPPQRGCVTSVKPPTFPGSARPPLRYCLLCLQAQSHLHFFFASQGMWLFSTWPSCHVVPQRMNYLRTCRLNQCNCQNGCYSSSHRKAQLTACLS